jgi:acid phosphatase class B
VLAKESEYPNEQRAELFAECNQQNLAISTPKAIVTDFTIYRSEINELELKERLATRKALAVTFRLQNSTLYKMQHWYRGEIYFCSDKDRLDADTTVSMALVGYGTEKN